MECAPSTLGKSCLRTTSSRWQISVRALSLALHVPYSRLREIVDGKRGVSADTALRLERYFGSEAQGWLALQAAYDLRIAEKQSAKLIKREIEPLGLAA
ncbi:HigA family addiction module antitoxin [Limnohabitans sp.]|uniref:HigA family addiction module antitoxin n=1 Tax=Limnohabitans sp. TaxID=1907725 RepID=UPI00345A3A12